MSQFFNKDSIFTDNTAGLPLALGLIYFGNPNTDPTDQGSNAKVPFEDRALTTPADSEQTLTSAGKLTNRLYFDGAYSVTITDFEGNVMSANPYWVAESSDTVINDSTVSGASVSDALESLQSQITALSGSSVAYADLWPVGALYLTTVNETPASRLGFGTWVAESEGRVLLGVGSGTDANAVVETFAEGDEAGEYEHVITETESPSHAHQLWSNGAEAAGLPQVGISDVATSSAGFGNTASYTIVKALVQTANRGISSSVGGDAAHTNIQPYTTIYIWRRTV